MARNFFFNSRLELIFSQSSTNQYNRPFCFRNKKANLMGFASSDQTPQKSTRIKHQRIPVPAATAAWWSSAAPLAPRARRRRSHCRRRRSRGGRRGPTFAGPWSASATARGWGGREAGEREGETIGNGDAQNKVSEKQIDKTQRF